VKASGVTHLSAPREMTPAFVINPATVLSLSSLQNSESCIKWKSLKSRSFASLRMTTIQDVNNFAMNFWDRHYVELTF
jgi:hypothetical protein